MFDGQCELRGERCGGRGQQRRLTGRPRHWPVLTLPGGGGAERISQLEHEASAQQTLGFPPRSVSPHVQDVMGPASPDAGPEQLSAP